MADAELLSEETGEQSSPVPYEPTGGFPVPIDMTDIYHYEKVVEEVTLVNNITGGFYMQEFLKAINVSSSYHAKAIYQYELAQAERKGTHGRIMMDCAPAQLAAKGLRVNEVLLKSFTESHPDVQAAYEKEAYWKALAEYLKKKVEKFERAHDDARGLFKGSETPRGQGHSLPSGRDT